MSLVLSSLRDLAEVFLVVGLICWSRASGLQPFISFCFFVAEVGIVFLLVRSAVPVLPFVGTG